VLVSQSKCDSTLRKKLGESGLVYVVFQSKCDSTLDKMNSMCWFLLSQNPNIFTYDYKAIKDRMFGNGGIKEDLIKNRFHPKNLHKFNAWGFGIDDDDDTEYDTYEEWRKH
jgi:hypothetical protein